MEKYMKKIILASLLAFGLTSSAIASEDGSGAYVGLAYGATAFDDGDARTVIKDDTDSGYKIYGGYQFNKIVGVEASYTDYGTFTYVSGRTLESSAFGVAANLGYNFLDGQLRPFGLLGLSALSLDQNNGPVYDDDSTISVTYGVGVEYYPKAFKGVGFRALWNVEAYSVDDRIGSDSHIEAFGMFSAAVAYKF
jgi:opacity protein-like surface antigen